MTLEKMSRETELELVALAKGGSGPAFERLLAQWRPLIVSQANYWHRKIPAADLDDLIQEGRIGLHIAIARFEPSRERRLITYAGWWVKQRMRHFLAYRIHNIHVPIEHQKAMRRDFRTLSLDQPGGADRDEPMQNFVTGFGVRPADRMIQREALASLQTVLEQLPAKDREILTRNRLQGHTLTSIAADMGISLEAVRQRVDRAIRRARTIARRLESFPNGSRMPIDGAAALSVA